MFAAPKITNCYWCLRKYTKKYDYNLSSSVGWVFWDDENIEELDGGNMVQGVVPEGVYEKDTLIYFCCNNKGIKSKPIELPLNNQFYLLAYRSAECQQVKGAKVTSEFVQWDDEDRGNTNAHSKFVPYGVELDSWNTRIFYCYYDTGKICFLIKQYKKNANAFLLSIAIISGSDLGPSILILMK